MSPPSWRIFLYSSGSVLVTDLVDDVHRCKMDALFRELCDHVVRAGFKSTQIGRLFRSWKRAGCGWRQGDRGRGSSHIEGVTGAQRAQASWQLTREWMGLTPSLFFPSEVSRFSRITASEESLILRFTPPIMIWYLLSVPHTLFAVSSAVLRSFWARVRVAMAVAFRFSSPSSSAYVVDSSRSLHHHR